MKPVSGERIKIPRDRHISKGMGGNMGLPDWYIRVKVRSNKHYRVVVILRKCYSITTYIRYICRWYGRKNPHSQIPYLWYAHKI